MSLALTEEQLLLADSARTFLGDRGPVSHLRNLRDSGGDAEFSRELWSEMAGLGWPAVLVPEEYGGLDYGFAGIGLLLEQCGRTLTPTPLLSTALMSVAGLTRYGSRKQRRSYLPRIAAGNCLIAIAAGTEGRHRSAAACEAIPVADGYAISGRCEFVVDGQAADALLVGARMADSAEEAVFLVPADSDGLRAVPGELLDTHKAATVTFDAVRVGTDTLLGRVEDGAALLEYLLDVGRVGQSAELLGVAEEAFERTLRYLKERKQFGVTIGSFQALQHRAAVMFAELALCRSAVLHTLRAMDNRAEDLPRLASMTKAKLVQTAHTVCTEAIQMHGGIGMTDEHDIGFFLKRCRILETLYGDRYYHIDRFAALRGY